MISTIIPTTTGGLQYIAQLIPGLSQEENNEIIIIDNASRDGTTNFLQQFDCLVKINKTNISFSESNNLGSTYAKGDKLLFMNNDMIINPGLIREMENTFEIDKEIAVVGCQLRLMDRKDKVHHAGVMFTEDYIPYELGLNQPWGTSDLLLDDPRVTGIREVPSVTAACMMVKKDVFNEVGGFDTRYIYGWEDTDLVLRIREKGYKVWYTGKAWALHKHFGGKDRGRFKYESRNREIYDEIWVHTGRAKEVLGEFRNG